MKEMLLEKVRTASCFGVTSQLISVQYFDTQSGTFGTKFLSAQDVLKEHAAANTQAIYDLLQEELLSPQLDIKYMMRLAIDSACSYHGRYKGGFDF